MVKNLRNKFVIVTTLLLLTLFGSFLIINTLYTNYWNEIEIVEMLEWIAYSGIFTSDNESGPNSEEELISDITKDESPIAGIVLDQNGNLILSRILGESGKLDIPETVLQKMYEDKGEKKRIGKYYYSYTVLNDGNILLVIMRSVAYKFSGGKILGICILLAGGIALLETVIFGLSKFVTHPAAHALLREKQFISDASHELKTPLGAISINAQALQIERPNDLYIKNIVSESQRMSRLIEKLLVLSKLDEQEIFEFKRINLSDICEEMALTYESVAFEKQVSFEYEIKSENYIAGNEDEIRQLLAILIDNAIKNTNEGGSIALTCMDNKKHSEIVITNSGSVIPEDVLPHVFERFYSSDLARTSGSFGLGLAIAKSIVDRHKGSINAESKSGIGTTFRVLI